MNNRRLPNRDTLITILLIFAGIVLAVTLFGAGAIWKGRSRPHNTGVGGVFSLWCVPALAVTSTTTLRRTLCESEYGMPLQC